MTLHEYWALYEQAQKNDDAAVKLCQMSSTEDYSAKGLTACLYFLDKRVNADQQQMVSLLQQALDKDDPFACYCYGVMLADGIQMDKDRKKAKKEMEYAAKAGLPRAQYVLGLLHYWDQEFYASHTWLSNAVNGGYKQAACLLAQHYNNGWGCVMNKHKAFDLFIQVVDTDLEAVAMIAVYHYTGSVVDKDIAGAINFAKIYANRSGDQTLKDLAASNDYGKGMYLLGLVFQRANVNAHTLADVFEDAVNHGCAEAEPIAKEMRRQSTEIKDKETLKESFDGLKDVGIDILKNSLGL